jgi:hypothetical protein
MKKTFFYQMTLLSLLLCTSTYHETSRVQAEEANRLEINVGYATVTIKKDGGKLEHRSGQITKCNGKCIFLESGGKKIRILLSDILKIDYLGDGKYRSRQAIDPTIPSVFDPFDGKYTTIEVETKPTIEGNIPFEEELFQFDEELFQDNTLSW